MNSATVEVLAKKGTYFRKWRGCVNAWRRVKISRSTPMDALTAKEPTAGRLLNKVYFLFVYTHYSTVLNY
jgi:hypothetical protein